MAAGQFHCPRCKGAFQADQQSAAGRVRCPHCEEVVQLPRAEKAPVPPPPPSSSNRAQPAGTSSSMHLPPAVDGSTGVDAGTVKQVDFAPSEKGAEENAGPLVFEPPVKSVGRGRQKVELTQRSQEERQSRKGRRNLLMWFFCLVIIFATMALLLI